MSCFERFAGLLEEAEIPQLVVVRLCSAVSSEKVSQRYAEPHCVLLKIQARKNKSYG